MKSKNLTDVERAKIAQILLESCIGGKPEKGKMAEVATTFNVTRRTIAYIWAKANQQKKEGRLIDVASKLKGKKGRQKLHLDVQQVALIPFHLRTTIRKMSKQLQVSKSTVGRWISLGVVRSHTNAMRPSLTDANKAQRLHFALSKLAYNHQSNAFKFKDMSNVVHIDEKWFHLSKATERYYVLPDEITPNRACQSKKFIPKIMFMCAVARPIISETDGVIFDGKLGIFPFVKQEAAKRSSKNRVAGTRETKPIDSITKEVIKRCLIEQVLPAIRDKWPSVGSRHIVIQQDNARPHINNKEADFRTAATIDGFDIELNCQPPNSPDLNVLDLGFFRAIQSLQTDTAAYSLDELVSAVQKAYADLDARTLNNVFISSQACMLEIMKKMGGNDYQLPHMNKASLARQGLLPDYLTADFNLVQESYAHLERIGSAANWEEIGRHLTPL